MRRGFSLVELVVALGVAGVLLAFAMPPFLRVRDGLAVRQAALEVSTFYQAARHSAIRRATRVRIEFGGDSLRGVYEGITDSVFRAQPGPARHAVAFSASRTVVRIDANGLGFGAANTTIVLRRGAVTESLTTSRMGRLKRW
jgi:prepilin-type N-terminal cleavage/methylation domain-containing protein